MPFIGLQPINTPGADSVTSATIADDAIDSEHYVDGSIDTAHIADDQITLAKMAGGTDGNVISYDGSGDPVAIATGTDGQVLTSTGAGSPPAFEDAAAGGSMNLIGTVVASDDATITITGLDSTYDTYVVEFSDLFPASDAVEAWFRVGDSSGIDSGAADYSWYKVGEQGRGASTINSSFDETDSQTNLAETVGNANWEGFQGSLRINGPGDTTRSNSWTFHTVSSISEGHAHEIGFGSKYPNATIVLDRIQFLFSSGNITSGRMTVWGLAHA